MGQLRVIENTLVPVYVTSTGEKVVNGRELHSVLQSMQDFSTWVKARLKECDAVENEDFERFHKKMEANNATMIEYIIKLDTAKEIAMLERNAKGKQVRRYFIQVEKKYRESETCVPTGKELMALAVLEAQKTISEQNQAIERMKPKEIFADAVAASKSSILIGELAKMLRQNGIGRPVLYHLRHSLLFRTTAA